MKSQIEKLGKVSITVEKDYWNITKSYDKLVVVERESTHTCYLSRKPVHPGVSIDNREYWVKFSKYSDIPYEIVQELGNSEELAISQKVITQNIQILQQQINQIIATKINIDFTLNPTIIYAGETTSVTINVSVELEATDIFLYKNGSRVANGSGVLLTYTDINEEPIEQNIVYSVDCTINNVIKHIDKKLIVVDKIYYGAGVTYSDAVINPSPRLTPNGLYTVPVENNETYIYFNVPNSMTINNASMNGFDFPLEDPVTVTIDNTEYKSYRSSNTLDAGTYIIILS